MRRLIRGNRLFFLANSNQQFLLEVQKYIEKAAANKEQNIARSEEINKKLNKKTKFSRGVEYGTLQECKNT